MCPLYLEQHHKTATHDAQQEALPASMQLVDGVLEFLPALVTGDALAFVDIPKAPGKHAQAVSDWLSFGQRYEQVGRTCARGNALHALPAAHFSRCSTVHLSALQVGDVPRYDLSTAAPLDAGQAQGRVLQSLGSAAPGSGSTPGSCPAAATRSRCFNCGSYAHSLKVGPPLHEPSDSHAMPSCMLLPRYSH